MKKRIRNGTYDFPKAEWKHVTQQGRLFSVTLNPMPQK
jgi:hypothetical protein